MFPRSASDDDNANDNRMLHAAGMTLSRPLDPSSVQHRLFLTLTHILVESDDEVCITCIDFLVPLSKIGPPFQKLVPPFYRVPHF